MTWNEAANLTGIVPAVALMVASAGAWPVPSRYILVAVGLGLSAVADWFALQNGGTGAVGFYYLAWQVAFVLWGLLVGSRGAAWVVPALIALLGLSGLSASVSGDLNIDWLVTLVGSVLLCAVAWKRKVLLSPVLLYFGVGSVLYLLMVLALSVGDLDGAKAWWFAYQGARLAASLAFAVIVVRERWGLPT